MDGQVFFEDEFEAYEAAGKIKASLKDKDVIVRVEKSPYGGYRIKKIPREMALAAFEYLPSLYFGRSY